MTMAKTTGVKGLVCVVTGGSGFVGRRIVELLVEAGAAKVVSFDLRAMSDDPRLRFLDAELEKKKVKHVVGNITNKKDVDAAIAGADIVWHTAALVGPYFPKDTYKSVNVDGTQNIVDACRKHNVKKLVASSSPSTRFDGNDIVGKREDQLEVMKPGEFLQEYAETKARGEMIVREACGEELLTVVVAPHQVYGPRDPLFLPNLLYPAETKRLRIFGDGKNMVSFCYVDNYADAMIKAADELYTDSPCLGKFYIVTDDKPQYLWDFIDKAGVEMGYESIKTRTYLPNWLMFGIAYAGVAVTSVTGMNFRINPFTVKMMTIHRWFDISNAKKDLHYKPIVTSEEGFRLTMDWFKKNEEWSREQAMRTFK